jgi:hypothetical protein
MDPFPGFNDPVFCTQMMENDAGSEDAPGSDTADASASVADCRGGQSSSSAPSNSGASPSSPQAPQTCQQAANAAALAFIKDGTWLIGVGEIKVGVLCAKEIIRALSSWLGYAGIGHTPVGMAGNGAYTALMNSPLVGADPTKWQGWGAFFTNNTPLVNGLSHLINEKNACFGPAK